MKMHSVYKASILVKCFIEIERAGTSFLTELRTFAQVIPFA